LDANYYAKLIKSHPLPDSHDCLGGDAVKRGISWPHGYVPSKFQPDFAVQWSDFHRL